MEQPREGADRPGAVRQCAAIGSSSRDRELRQGKVAKTGDMKIDTPVATMGIRGTTPHVEISDDGTVKFSTLIEENKGRTPERRAGVEPNKRAVPVKPRQAKNGSSPDASSAKEAENNLDKKFNINLKICRGC